MIYKALKEQQVQIPGGVTIVPKGALVAFAFDPGAGWEKVKANGNDHRKKVRDMDNDRRLDAGSKGGVSRP